MLNYSNQMELPESELLIWADLQLLERHYKLLEDPLPFTLHW